MATYQNLNDKGYLIVDALLPEEAEELCAELIDYTFDVIFESRGYHVDRDHPACLNLISDQTVRKIMINDNRNESVWKNGNSRNPIISKSCGMADLHYNIKKMKMIDFNPKIYKIASEVIGTEKLVFMAGLERISIKPGIVRDPQTKYKAEGASDMNKHIDSCLFNDQINYPFRIQSLICLSSGNDVPYRDSGSLNLLVNFHHYWKFAGRLFHYKHGIVPLPKCDSRFQTLPSDWDKEYLPELIGHIKVFTLFQQDRQRCMEVYDIPNHLLNFYNRLIEEGITVPDQYKDVHWEIIALKPGQMVFWHQYLPHQSLRNKSKTPRIVVYYSPHPILDSKWYGSENHAWLLDMVSSAKFYYGVNNNFFPRTIRNEHEYEYLRDNHQLHDVINYIKSDPLARRLVGIDPY